MSEVHESTEDATSSPSFASNVGAQPIRTGGDLQNQMCGQSEVTDGKQKNPDQPPSGSIGRPGDPPSVVTDLRRGDPAAGGTVNG